MLIISKAVEAAATLAELVEVVLLEGDDVMESARLAELDNGLRLVLAVSTSRILRPAFDHIEGAQSLDARTEEIGARRIARERRLSDGVIVQRNFIASATSKRGRMCVSIEREGVGHDQVGKIKRVLEVNPMPLVCGSFAGHAPTLQGYSQMRREKC